MTLAGLLGPIAESARKLAAELDPGDTARFCVEQSMAVVYPEHQHDPLFRESIYKSSYDTVDAMWRIIAGRDPLDASAPRPPSTSPAWQGVARPASGVRWSRRTGPTWGADPNCVPSPTISGSR